MIVMYLPPKFHMSDDDTWGIVSDVGAATLVLSATNGLESAFAPVIVSEDRQKLYSHLARANSWWRAVTPGAEVLALFVAASAYVSPLNYPSRIENPNVVPTWNYVMVQVRGKVRIHDDAEWKLNQVRALTHQFEHDHDPEWLVDDMDEEYRASQLKAIVGVEIDVDVDGEVLARSNHVFDGYWNQPIETEKALEGGWFHTGDGGFLDGAHVVITDRKKDVIITGGENVSSIEVEDCLFQHPAVAEVAVIGVPDAKWGESIKALVVVRSGSDVDEEALIAHCRTHMATGKLQKFKLREPYWRDLERGVN